MTHDDFMKGKIMNRRKAVMLAGMGGAYFIQKANGASIGKTKNSIQLSNIDLLATPEVTEGPFFVDEQLNRSNILSNTSRASVVNGLPFQLQLTVCENDGVAGYYPLEGATVDLWHADAIGTYSDVASGNVQNESTLGQTWLRGYQITDANGMVNFTTIYPGWYMGRTIHFHFKIRRYDASNRQTYEFTSQLFIDDAINDVILANAPYNSRGSRQVRNTNDNIYSAQNNGSTVGSQLMLNISNALNGTGKTATFVIGFDSEPNTPVKEWGLY